MTTTKKEDGNFIGHKTCLTAGTKAPDFEAKDQHGKTVKLSDFRGKHLILYFYPKDDTPPCTAQACSLRNGYSIIKENDHVVLGVSADDEKTHLKFAEKYDLPFQLLADTEKKLIFDYDVWGKKMLFERIMDGIVRTTFIIDPEGIIKRVITDVNTENHARQALIG
jgi:peroxiredoxin Q/BCP